MTINKLITTATAELGYLEKATNAKLDDKTANAGSGNWTKYARDLDALPNWYNTKKNGYAWCDVFVDWCFVQTFGQKLAETLLCGVYYGAGCPSSANYFKAKKQWYTTPQVGDQIFFTDSSGAIVHTGLVVELTAANVTVIEGNTSGASGVVANGGGVHKKTYPVSFNRIAGYGRPDWLLLPLNVPELTLDNTPDEYAAASIRKAIDRRILLGNEKGDLMLHAPITRQDLFVILDRLGVL